MSSRTPSASISFDHGCQYLTAESDEFATQLQQWESKNWIAKWEPRVARWSPTEGFQDSTASKQSYVGVPTMQSLCEKMRATQDVRCNVEVSKLTRCDSLWNLSTEAEHLGAFDHLLVTIPPIQASRLLSDVLVGDHLSTSRMSSCWTLMLALKSRLDINYDAVRAYDTPIAWIARDSSKPQRPSEFDCWVIQASPEWSAQNLEESGERIAFLLTSVLNEMVGRDLDIHSSVAHRWRYAIPVEPFSKTTCLSHLSLGLCGDWCNGQRAEAAWHSGRSLAFQLLDHVS